MGASGTQLLDKRHEGFALTFHVYLKAAYADLD
jgi:hypothetical protein